MFSVLAATLLGVAVVQTAPVPSTRQSITALTITQVDTFTPYTYYASAGYCNSSLTHAWDCGANCNANPDFLPVASGGDGSDVQYWYVGYDPTLATVIVVHQGTNPKKIEALLTDAEIIWKKLDPTLFPGLSSDIEVHDGFADDQARSATQILAAVQETMSVFGTTSVTLVGHSLGAALSLLDSVYLPLWLPAGTNITTYGYGLPRVGNQAFADYVDANLHLTHVNNKKDPIPILPGMILGYVHPSGEVHIEESGEWAKCPGQDNPSRQCIVGDVPHLWNSKLYNHYGPYNGVTMGC